MSGVLWTVYLTHFVTHSKDFASWKGFHVDEESIPQFLVWSNIIDLARAKSEALNNIYSLFKQTIKAAKACNAGKRWKTTIGLISKSNYFLTRLQRETSRNFLVTRFMEEILYVFCLRFFTAAYFHLALVAASISHFVTALQNFQVVLPTKKCLLQFSTYHSKSMSPFFSLSFAGLPPTFCFSLSFSCSIFQICGHDNFSKLNTLDNTDTETISAFRFRLYWLFCCLCFTRRRWLCHFPPK